MNKQTHLIIINPLLPTREKINDLPLPVQSGIFKRTKGDKLLVGFDKKGYVGKERGTP